MKNIPYLLRASLIVSLLLMVTSCKKDFLESAPYALEDAQKFYKTTEQCKGAVMQAYNRTVHLGPIYLFIRHGLNEYAGDDLLRTYRDDFTVWHNFSPDNVQFLWGWKYCFQGIYLCNYTLNQLQTAPIPQTDKDVLVAECKSIRAFMYYMVATRWGSTPIITTVLSADEYYKVPFSSATDVYAQVIKDFKEAIPALPKSWGNEDKGRFSQAAAKHMLAKTYMQLAGYPINKTENWQKAVDILAEFVPQAKRGEYNLDLLPNYGDVYAKSHDQDKESVFEVNEMYLPEGKDISLEVGAPGNFLQAFIQPDEYEGFGGRDCFTADFLDEFEKDEDGKVIDKRYTYTVLEPGDVFYVTMAGDTCLHNSLGRLTIKNVKVDKATNTLTYDIKNDSNKPYDGWTWVGKNNESYPNYKYLRNAKERTGLLNNAGLFGEDLNIKYLRFADAILCYAEALNEVGRSAEAVNYVNELRSRANNTVSLDSKRIYQKTLITGTLPLVDAGLGQSAMRNAIRHEWRVELGGEDWRYENIRRWGIAEERLHIMATKSLKKGPADNDAIKYQKGTWDYFPIPSNEYKLK
ncbi:MAG: RagB/SusD family nutrient uptake outer membrane protein [Bacteroidota bacterium]